MEKYDHNVKFLRKRVKATWKDRPPILTFWQARVSLATAKATYIHVTNIERSTGTWTQYARKYLTPVHKLRFSPKESNVYSEMVPIQESVSLVNKEGPTYQSLWQHKRKIPKYGLMYNIRIRHVTSSSCHIHPPPRLAWLWHNLLLVHKNKDTCI
jgi:hypothetical protein